MRKYDAIIIGAGQAGVPLAKKLAQAGWKTALVERDLVGGTCVNYGCTPTKTMIASARMAYLAGRGSEYGVPVSSFKVDMPAIIKRKDKLVAHARGGNEQAIEETKNLELIYGTASFVDKTTVSVALSGGGKKELSATHIFINTGGRTAIPGIDGLSDINYLTSTTILDLKEVPEHLLIVGGSYIALEFGQMFRRFGSKVTILEHAPRFLPKEDEDIATCMQQIIAEDGIALHVNANPLNIEKKGKQIEVTVSVNKRKRTISCSHILIAAGRIPNTGDLQLANAGVKTNDRGYIEVDKKLQTKTKGIYALGDVKGGPAFTHISYNDYVIVTKNLLEKQNATTTNRAIPYCMFTDPELGRVGMTETEAKEKGYKIQIATLPMKHVARAVETSDTRGMMKAIVDTKTKKILGVAILGAQGGELMSVLQMAMMGGITHDKLRSMIFAHPTFSESINNLFMSIDKMP